MARFFRSKYFVPALFFLLNWKIWLGTHGFVHDTGDGIAAFKFASFLPKYWNWFEAAGQPYWYDLARLQDPVSWLLIFPLKLLPLGTFTAYGIFILLRICVLGVGIGLLVDSLGFNWRARNLGVFVALFGSLAAGIYEQIGMLDLALPFVFISWCLIRLAQTDKGVYLAGIGVVLIHGSIGYHLVMLTPGLLIAGIGAAIFFRPQFFSLFRALKRRALGLATLAVGTGFLFASLLATTHENGLLPMTRNMHYNSVLDVHGKNLNGGVYGGRNIFDTTRFATANSDCHKSMQCSEYYPEYLITLFTSSAAGFPIGNEFILFIGRVALLLGLLALFGARRKLCYVLWAEVGMAFLLSLGTQTFVWPLAQRAFPLMGYVRHTHFFSGFMVLGLIGLFCIGYEFIESRVPSLRKMLVTLIIFEGLLFHFRQGVPAQMSLPQGLKALVSPSLPAEIVSREVRAFNPYAIPQTSAGTAYGRPTALEPVKSDAWRPPRVGELDDFDIRWMGFVTPFMLKHTVKTRLFLSSNPEAFKRAFGVRPYSVLSLHPWKDVQFMEPDADRGLAKIANGKILVSKGLRAFRQSSNGEPMFDLPLRIQGENLAAEVNAPASMVAYLSLSYPHISGVFVDGKSTEFFKSNLFGLAFALPAGVHSIVIRPEMGTAYNVFLLFYVGSFLLILYLALEYRGQWVGVKAEHHPFKPKVENLA